MPKRRANGEGSIYPHTKDKNGKTTLWAAQYTDNVGKRRTLYGKTQQIVKEKLKAAIAQSDKGINVNKDKIMFVEWLEEWLEVYHKPIVKESTYALHYRELKIHVIPEFQNILLKDLRSDMLQKFFNKKAESGRTDKIIDPDTGEKINRPGGLSISLRHDIKILIASALNQAIDDNIILNNVAKKVKLPPNTREDVKVLSVDERRMLEEQLLNSKSFLSFAILFDLYTGLRIGELTALKIGDIDFEKAELTVQRSIGRVEIPESNENEAKTKLVESTPKTAKGKRTIPLPPFLIDLLKSFIKERNMRVEMMCRFWGKNWSDEGILFITSNGTTVEHAYLRQLLDNQLAKAGIGHIKFHALRHTFATRCIEAGFDIKSLSDILGHSDASMTLNIYAHALSDQKRDNMNKLSLFHNNRPEEE